MCVRVCPFHVPPEFICGRKGGGGGKKEKKREVAKRGDGKAGSKAAVLARSLYETLLSFPLSPPSLYKPMISNPPSLFLSRRRVRVGL